MFDSISIGLSGMEAYSKGLQTISNNVANLNTLGFKADSPTFSDFYNTGDGSNADAEAGVPKGAGVRVGDPLMEFSQGNLQQSNGDLDLAIQGSGFLVLKDAANQTIYGRTGQFSVDSQGYVSMNKGAYRLTVIDPATGQPTLLNVNALKTNPPLASSKISLSNNVSSTGTSADVPNVSVYDAAGGAHTWDVKFTAVGSGAPNQWTVTVTDESGTTLSTSTVSFSGNAIDPSTETIAVSASPAGAPPLTVTLDLSALTSFSSGTTSTVALGSVDGRKPGDLTDVTLDSSGKLQAAYTNGQTTALGSVAIASFQDPQLLTRATGGAGLFRAPATVQPLLTASGDARVGTLVSKEVEASNVDLTGQFGQLILIQRGFQACSQVLSVSNDMIQQLFGIRGQG